MLYCVQVFVRELSQFRCLRKYWYFFFCSGVGLRFNSVSSAILLCNGWLPSRWNCHSDIRLLDGETVILSWLMFFLLKYTCILSTNSSVHFAICYNLSIQDYQYQLSQMDPRDALYHAHHAVYILLQRWTLSVINWLISGFKGAMPSPKWTPTTSQRSSGVSRMQETLIAAEAPPRTSPSELAAFPQTLSLADGEGTSCPRSRPFGTRP